MAWKRTPIRTNIPFLREIFQNIDDNGQSLNEISRKAGIPDNAAYLWRAGTAKPRLDNLIALIEAAGYRLKVEKIEKPTE